MNLPAENSSTKPSLSVEPTLQPTPAVQQCTPVASDFEDSDEGWTLSGDPDRPNPSWSASGGNPGGHIFAGDSASSVVWYFNAPSKFHGDFSGPYGKTLSFDFRQSSTSSQFESVEVVMSLWWWMAPPSTTMFQALASIGSNFVFAVAGRTLGFGYNAVEDSNENK